MDIKIQDNIYKSAIKFQQTYIVTLTLLPKLNNGKVETPSNHEIEDISNVILDKHKKENLVLKAFLEQRDQLDSQLKNAINNRRLDDAKSLQFSLNEINNEIQRMDIKYT